MLKDGELCDEGEGSMQDKSSEEDDDNQNGSKVSMMKLEVRKSKDGEVFDESEGTMQEKGSEEDDDDEMVTNPRRAKCG